MKEEMKDTLDIKSVCECNRRLGCKTLKHHQSGTSGFGTGGREIRVLRRAAYRGMYGRLLLLWPQILRLLQCHDGILIANGLRFIFTCSLSLA
jgi:hypothetical protein